MLSFTFCPVYAVVVDDWLTIALAMGLTARLTRLITLDTITAPIRERLPGLLGALVQCAWCTGVWVAIPVGLSWQFWADQPWWQVTALIGTLAWAGAAVSTVAMPSQHEVLTVGPVALTNADDSAVGAATDGTSLTVADIEAVVERAVGNALSAGERPGSV